MPLTNNVQPQKHFTSRQLEIVRTWAECGSQAELADHLGIQESTVHTHLKRLRAKLKVHRTVDVYLYLLRQGLLD